MLHRLLLTGLLSGAVAGVVLTLVHLVMVQPLIAQAEVYEEQSDAPVVEGIPHRHSGGLNHVHSGGNVPHLHEKNFHIHGEAELAGTAHVHADAVAGHSHDAKEAQAAHDHGAHSHDHEAWSPADGMERSLYTLGANIITTVAFGLLLVAGFALYGGPISIGQGLFWGGAGFLSFSFLPGLGLPPELPASAAGDLMARQIWWLGTAFVSVVGFAIIGFVKSTLWRVAAVLLMAVPHVIGAPHPEAGAVGASPPEMAAHFVMISLFASAVMWTCLGSSAAYVYGRLSEQPSAELVEPRTT